MPSDRRRRFPKSHDDLHGNVPDQSQAVLLLIDVLNDLSFPDNQNLVRRSVALAKSIAKLKKRCKKLGIPTIYVNDNRGRWRSDISAVLRVAAGDLHVRDFRLFVPADCVAALTEREHRRSLDVMKNSFGANTGPS